MVIEVTFDVTDVYISTTVSPVYVNVSFEAPSGGGGAEWGDITGTLSDQTDLQNALNAKFDDPTGDTTQYIAGDGSLVAFPITGQAGTLVREVRNVTGATLTKGTVVYINGASGNKPTVAKALATGDATSAQTFGLIQADISNNSNGYLVAFGDLDGLNTSAFAEGVQLYLSATTAGDYTSTKQYAPNHLVYIGVVTRQHVNQGRIEVGIQNGYEMDELHDVAAQTPSNNDGLFYNSTNSLWENKSIATALGYTPANSATTLTINGVTYDLSTSRTWSVGSVTGSGASGQVAYWTGTTSQAGSNNLFWDAANGRLGIGISTPTSPLHITATSSLLTREQIIRASVSDDSDSSFIITNGTSANNLFAPAFGGYCNSASVYSLGFTGFTTAANDAADSPLNLGLVNFLAARTTTPLDPYNGTLSAPQSRRLFTFGNITNNGILTIYATTNVGINSTTDSGQRLQVQGTTLLNGNVTFSSSTGMFWDATNSRLGIGTNAPASALEILSNAGRLRLKQSTTGSIFNGIDFVSSSNTVFGSLVGNQDSGEIRLSAANGYFYNFFVNGATVMRINENQRVLIGSTTDTGERLQVTGDMKIVGSGLSSATNGLRVLNSASSVLLNVRNDGEISIGAGGWLTIGNSQRYIYKGINQTTILSICADAVVGSVIDFYGSSHATKPRTISLVSSFTPTSGSIAFSGFEILNTINQTGGANGITRGLYVNPTLTSAADFRAIETTNGKVIFGNLPTSSAGLPTGAIWNDAGTIKIV